jgi:hypothetical protein
VEAVAAVRMGSIVEHLHLGSCLPDSHVRQFLSKVQNTAVTARGYFPFKGQLKILKLLVVDNVTPFE